MEFIVTDLTRFRKGNPDVCIAGIKPKTKQCVRPWPYLKMTVCQKLGILPGAILQGDLSKRASAEKPHVEDMNHPKPLAFKGPCTSEEFEDVLEATTYPSIKEGFDGKVPPKSKVIPDHDPPNRSIITLKLQPLQIKIVRDQFDVEKVKFHLEDNDGSKYLFLPITDLGFYNLAIAKQAEANYADQLNSFIWSQKQVYLRIGLSRQTREMR